MTVAGADIQQSSSRLKTADKGDAALPHRGARRFLLLPRIEGPAGIIRTRDLSLGRARIAKVNLAGGALRDVRLDLRFDAGVAAGRAMIEALEMEELLFHHALSGSRVAKK